MKAVGHGDTTSAVELRHAGKQLLGGVTVCAADEIPQRTPYVIANLSERGDGPGTHWVCRCHGVWHDPLGSSGAAQRVQFERRVQGRWTDMDIEQPDDNSCGQRCLAALMTGGQLGEKAFLLL